jgi:hypothetical protein
MVNGLYSLGKEHLPWLACLQSEIRLHATWAIGLTAYSPHIAERHKTGC